MSTESDSKSKAEPEEEASTTVQTLRERAPEFEPEIFGSAKVPISKRNFIQEDTGELLQGDFGRPSYEYMSDHTFHCDGCGKEFETEKAANDHLRTQYRRWQHKHRLPGSGCDPDAPGYPVTFNDEEQLTVGDFQLRGRKNNANVLALVTHGAEVLRATSRRKYAIPPDYQFETWPPLQEGPLVFPDGSPRIHTNHLAAAIRYLASTGPFESYPHSEFTLYDRGESSFLLHHHEQTILIAAVDRNTD